MRTSFRLTIFFCAVLCLTTAFGVAAFADTAFRVAAFADTVGGDEGYKLAVFMYHNTARRGAGKYSVTPRQLENDIIYLKRQGYTGVFVADLINYVDNGVPLPPKPVMLMFDDGYADNYYHAFDIIKRHEFKVVISVVGKYTEDNYVGGELRPTHAHLTYEQISQMHQSGFVEFQNHTYNLHKTGQGRNAAKKCKSESAEHYYRVLGADLLALNALLKERCGIECTAVVYPFGAYSSYSEEIIKRLGFRATFTCTEGINNITRGGSLFLLKRYNRPSGISSEFYFRKKLHY